MPLMRVWIASLLFYLSVFAICELLRYMINRWLIRRLPRFATGLLLEFIGTLQVCTPMFDVNLILHTYGLFGIFIEITTIEIANAFFLRDAIAHPCPLVTTASRKRLALRTAILVFGVQLAAAYLSYFFARTFWKLGLHPMHDELLTADHCEADLTAKKNLVALTAGSLIEGLATFSSKAVEFFASEWYADSKAQMLINCMFAGFLTTIGINYTGMYANPIVAWACTFNCTGITHLGHLIVYWLSPLIGWFLADAVFGEQECMLECFAEEEEESNLTKLKNP
uniref:Aquaporin n=1 Tax=Elaeophora elaphi TaxID=1147741 RepID=A0A0R3RNF3_9BILA